MREKSWFREYGLILAAGVAVGIAALILTASGNPKNMGFCIACFLRDLSLIHIFPDGQHQVDGDHGDIQDVKSRHIGDISTDELPRQAAEIAHDDAHLKP